MAPAVDTTFALDANGGTLSAEDEGKIFSIGTGDNYTLPTPTRDGFAFAGWYYGATKIATSGNWSADFGGETPALVAKWMIEQAHSTDFEDGTIPSWITGGGLTVVDGALQAVYNSKGIQFKPVETVAGASVGTKYVFEMDFTFHGIDAGSDNNLAFIGFSHTNATWQGGTHKWAYLGANNVGDTVYFYGNAAKKDQTINIRFEFTVTGASTGDLEVYVNGMTGSNTTGGVIKDLNTGDFHQFNIQWRGAANNRNLSATIDNVTVAVQMPVSDSTVTLDPNGGTLPEGAKNEIPVSTGNSYTLPAPTAEGFEFVGWFDGDSLIPLTGTWAGSNDVTLKAKWLDATVCTYEDIHTTATGWTNKTKWTISGYDAATVDAEGTKYVLNFKYTYGGLSGFSITDGVVTPNLGSETLENRNFGFPRFMGADATGATGKIAAGGNDKVRPAGNFVNAAGVVVTDENGKLLDEFATLTAEEIFYSELTWGGIKFKLGAEYDVTVTAVMGADSKFTVTTKAVAADGTVQNGSIATYAAVVNIEYFYVETRGPGGPGAYTLTQSFTDATFAKYVAVDSAVKAPVVEETPEETPAE
jgi:hypothetical protein